MKKRLIWLVMAWSMTCLLLVPPAQAVEDIVSGTLQNAETGTVAGTPLDVTGMSGVGLQVTISATATVVFETTVDGTTWNSHVCASVADTAQTLVTSASATGGYQCAVSGVRQFQARISDNTGTVTVKGLATSAAARSRGSGGGLGAEVDTLQSVFARGKEITGANSEANCVKIGDGTNYGCFYWDATTGWRFKTSPVADARMYIPTDKTLSIYDEEGGAAVETIDPDAASTLAMYQYAAAYRPKKSVWFGAGSLDGDGTQCPALATTVTINSGPKIPTFICTDNDAATLYGSVKLPDSYDGGTFTFEHVYIQTAADTAVLNGDIACQVRSNGVAPSSTWGTEVAIDDAAVTGSNKNDFTTSAAVTCAGTPIAGDMLYFRYQLDATGTTTAVATLHHVGFKMEYSAVSRSD